MPATNKIKRSTGSAPPALLAQGELAYSAALDGSWNDASAGKLYVGKPSASGTAQVLSIGGTFYTSKIDGVTAGTAAANKVVLLDANNSISGLGVVSASTFSGTVITGTTSVTGGNLHLSSNTISSTDTNGNIAISPNGSGLIQLYSGGSQWQLPVVAAQSGAVLTSGAAGVTTWSTTFSGTVITGTTSVTGGNLRLSSNTISSTDTNGAVNINPNGTGSVVMYGGDSTNSWNVPRGRGNSGQVLSTAANGTTSWVDRVVGTITIAVVTALPGSPDPNTLYIINP